MSACSSLPPLLDSFFRDRLPKQRNASRSTVASYRDALRMLILFLDDASRSGHPVSLLVIDIDRFKCMNDRFGHDVGDVVLTRVADVILNNVRRGDVVARYGGEEIVVLLPSTGIAAASAIADRIRSLVDLDVFHQDRDAGRVTVSIGVAAQQGEGVSFRGLFKAADEALYLAKERGRNRVELAPPVSLAAAA